MITKQELVSFAFELDRRVKICLSEKSIELEEATEFWLTLSATMTGVELEEISLSDAELLLNTQNDMLFETRQLHRQLVHFTQHAQACPSLTHRN